MILTKYLRVLWNRLPRIAVYIMAFYALFWVGQHVYYWGMPGDHFVRFYKVQVQNGEEGEDIPYQVCRTKQANYQVKGVRTFYMLPDDESTQGQRVASSDLQGALENDECANLFIRTEQFEHKPGNYYFVTELVFSVEGFEKRISYKSNIYTIYEKRQLSPDEIQKQIDELQQQIDSLKAQLAEARSLDRSTEAVAGADPGNSQAVGSAQNSGSNRVSSTPQNTPQGGQNEPQQPIVESEEPPRNALFELVSPQPICTPDLLGLRTCL